MEKEFLYILNQGIYRDDIAEVAISSPASSELYGASYFNADKDSYGFEDYRDGQWWEDEAQQVMNLYNPDTVYEIGCGYGFLVNKLMQKGIMVYGSDISEYAIHKGWEELGLNEEIAVLDATSSNFAGEVPFTKGELDLLIAKDVIEHWGDKLEQGIENMVSLEPKFIHIVTPMGETKDSPITAHCKDKYWNEKLWYYIGANSKTDLTHTALHERSYWAEQFEKHGYKERRDLSDTVKFPTHESPDYAKGITLILERV